MQNDTTRLFESIEFLEWNFEILRDAIEIADLPLPSHFKHLAINSRDRSIKRLQDVMDKVISILYEESHHV